MKSYSLLTIHITIHLGMTCSHIEFRFACVLVGVVLIHNNRTYIMKSGCSFYRFLEGPIAVYFSKRRLLMARFLFWYKHIKRLIILIGISILRQPVVLLRMWLAQCLTMIANINLILPTSTINHYDGMLRRISWLQSLAAFRMTPLINLLHPE